MSMYVSRDKLAQAGLGNIQNGVKAGQRSLAAALAGGLGLSDIKSFICAARIGDRWIYVACYKGNITHDGDIVGDEDKIKAALANDISRREWDLVIAPNSWGIDGSVERDITTDIKRNKAVVGSLKPIKRDFRILAVLGAAIIILFVGYSLYQNKLAREAEEIAAAELAEATAKASQAGGDELDPVKFVQQCENFIASHPQFPGGWEPVGAVCERTGGTLTWKRPEFGLIEPFSRAVPNAVINMDGKAAELRQQFPAAASVPNELESLNLRLQQLTDMAVSRGFKFQTKGVNDPVTKKLTWSIAPTFVKPSQVLPYLNGPGFKVQVINMSANNGIRYWDMKGVQYGK